MYNGIEVDVLSLGDADCIVVTQWVDPFPHRVLIDGGSGDAEVVIDFLRGRNYTTLWAAVCTHLHDDHARGLIKVVQNRHITIHNGWMHDIRRHVSPDALRRASSADDGVREVLENTCELARSLAARGVALAEPFAGSVVAGYPFMTVLGPTVPFYRGTIADFMRTPPPSRYARQAGLVPPASRAALAVAPPLFGSASLEAPTAAGVCSRRVKRKKEPDDAALQQHQRNSGSDV